MVSSGVQGSEASRESKDNLDNHFANRCITSDTLCPVQQTEEAHAHNVKMSKQKKIQFNSYVYMPHSLVDLETFHLQSAATTVGPLMLTGVPRTQLCARKL